MMDKASLWKDVSVPSSAQARRGSNFSFFFLSLFKSREPQSVKTSAVFVSKRHGFSDYQRFLVLA